jgi:DNA repair protein RadA/Sms
VRGTPQAGLRVKEAAQLGFTRCILPAANRSRDTAVAGCETCGVETVEDALDALLKAS